ncbi:MAG: archease [Candidatus Micrarchaeota archaeon]
MKKFKFIDHRADMFIESNGKSYHEALENCALGLFDTICDSKKLSIKKKIIVREKASNLVDLTTFLLSKIVSEGDSREMMFKKMKVIKFEKGKKNFSIAVEVFGQPQVHKLGRMYVKAVTHHEAAVENKNKKWRIKILPDI